MGYRKERGAHYGLEGVGDGGERERERERRMMMRGEKEMRRRTEGREKRIFGVQGGDVNKKG